MNDYITEYNDQVNVQPHMLRGQLRKLILNEAPKEAIEFMQKYLGEFFATSRPAVHAGILSI